MNQYYKVKIRIETEVEGKKGETKIKVITEEYIVSDVSPTAVEAKMTAHLSGLMAEFEITSIALTKIVDVLS